MLEIVSIPSTNPMNLNSCLVLLILNEVYEKLVTEFYTATYPERPRKKVFNNKRKTYYIQINLKKERSSIWPTWACVLLNNDTLDQQLTSVTVVPIKNQISTKKDLKWFPWRKLWVSNFWNISYELAWRTYNFQSHAINLRVHAEFAFKKSSSFEIYVT